MRVPFHALAASALLILMTTTGPNAEPAAANQPASEAPAPADVGEMAATGHRGHDPEPKQAEDKELEAEKRNLLLAIIAYGAQFSRR